MKENLAVQLTKEMVSFNTYEVKGKTEILKYIKEVLNNTVAEVKIYHENKENPYLIAHLKTDKPEFTFMMEGHLDIVSPEGMVVPPFEAIEKDGIITGRGVSDMKAGCATMLAAFIEAAKSENRKGDIYLVYTTDEEYAGAEIIEIMEKELIPKCDFVMISEPTNEILCTAHKGNAWVEVEFLGKGAHASTPDLGINSIYMASDFICKFKKYTDELYERQKSELYGKPTINVGVIEGGSQPNVVPVSTKIKIDKRYLPDDNINNFIKEIETILAECKKENPQLKAKINVIVDCYSVVVDRDNSNLKIIKSAIDESFGEECQYGMVPFWGEGGYINKYGIPVVYFGPGAPEYAHTKDEQCSIEKIKRVTSAYYNIIKKFCL